jgi:adenylosuccinate synthase
VTHVIVTDLGYGDAGKGSVTDFLCSPRGTPLRGKRPVAAVVRFNGGSQAAHNVVHPGREHAFAQFGAGTFRDVPTFLSRHMMADPLALAAEAAHLAEVGVPAALDLLTVDRDALVTTPYHIAANQARELARGTSRHGSCGKGIGETARFALDHPDLALRAGDCALPRSFLIRKLIRIRIALADEGCILGRCEAAADIADAYRAFASRVALADGDRHLRELLRQGPVIFEGAQGVLLDERYGFHPYTTWSTTTSANARTLLAEAGQDGYVLGVIRAYMTRHGPGPFVTEDPALDFPEPHNGSGGWQGAFRTGHPDTVALDYAVRANGGIDGLAVTHLDTAATRLLKLCTGYRLPMATARQLPDARDVRAIRENPHPEDLVCQEEITRLLMRARPVYEDGDTGSPDVLARDLSWVAKAPLVLRSYSAGPDGKTAHEPAQAGIP